MAEKNTKEKKIKTTKFRQRDPFFISIFWDGPQFYFFIFLLFGIQFLTEQLLLSVCRWSEAAKKENVK